MRHHFVWQIRTDVSEKQSVSMIKIHESYTLTMKAAGSTETSVKYLPDYNASDNNVRTLAMRTS